MKAQARRTFDLPQVSFPLVVLANLPPFSATFDMANNNLTYVDGLYGLQATHLNFLQRPFGIPLLHATSGRRSVFGTSMPRCPVSARTYIYIYAVKLLSGPSLGVFGSYYLVQVGFLEVIIWSKFVFLAYKQSGFKRFVLHTQLSFCVFFCPQFSGNFLKIAFFKKRVQNLGFQIFSVLSLNFENSLF